MELKEHRYKPPLKYLIIGIFSLPVSAMLLALAIDSVLLYAMLIGIIGLFFGAMGVTFLWLYLKNLGKENLIISEGHILIPGRWKAPVKLTFKEIIGISEFDTYDHVIEIESIQGVHLIESNWMNQNDFDATYQALLNAFEKDQLGFSPSETEEEE